MVSGRSISEGPDRRLLRPVAYTWKPFRASSTAIARPAPRVAPATRATGFIRLFHQTAAGDVFHLSMTSARVSLIHVVIEHDVENPDSLQAVPAFQRFAAGIDERCETPPVASGATIVGGYR
jgi:hypothetical protein